jgi:chromosome segregation ATPase
VDELRKQLREKQAEVTQLRKGTLDLRDKIQTLEFRVQEARSFSVQQEKTLHSLSLQIHRKDRQIRSLLKLEHGRLIRLVARFVLAVNGVNGRIDRLRGELLSRAEDEEPGAGETGSDASCEQA